VVEAGTQANDADAPAIRDSLLRRVIPSAIYVHGSGLARPDCTMPCGWLVCRTLPAMTAPACNPPPR